MTVDLQPRKKKVKLTTNDSYMYLTMLYFTLLVFLFLLVQKFSGCDGKGPDGDLPSTGGDDVSPYYRLSPCIIGIGLLIS